MTQSDEKVWYACYGSNILEKRFHCYILGGTPNGSSKSCTRCGDPSLPSKSEAFTFPNELYFAKKSKSWNGGGVAFLGSPNVSLSPTLGRKYLISKEQLVHIAHQESDSKEILFLDFQNAKILGFYILKDPSWYGKLLYLGEDQGTSIFTITNKKDTMPFEKPSSDYIHTISEGIKEVYNLDTQKIVNYFKDKKGIKDHFSDQELRNIIDPK